MTDTGTQWWRQQIGVGVERCPVLGGYRYWSRQPRSRVEFAARARDSHAAHLHGQGMPIAAISRELGVSATRVRELLQRSRNEWP